MLSVNKANTCIALQESCHLDLEIDTFILDVLNDTNHFSIIEINHIIKFQISQDCFVVNAYNFVISCGSEILGSHMEHRSRGEPDWLSDTRSPNFSASDF